MAAGPAMARALEALDVGSVADKINLIPQDFFAELCEQIIQHLNHKIPGVNTAELCQRIQTSGVEINVDDLAKIATIISFLFSTAARNNLSTEELVTTLGNAVSALPKHAVQVIRHVWNEQGKSISVSEDARNMATVGQFVDIKWKLGVAMSSDTCRSLKYPYVTVMLKVADPSGQITDRSFEMTIPQFKHVVTLAGRCLDTCAILVYCLRIFRGVYGHLGDVIKSWLRTQTSEICPDPYQFKSFDTEDGLDVIHEMAAVVPRAGTVYVIKASS